VVTYEELPAILTPQAAKAAQSYVLPPMQLKRGDFQAAFERAPHVAKGELYVGGQEQFYLEGQIAYAIPKENEGMLVQCSTQHPSEMQHVVAHALGLHSHHVQVECRRMGGGFGGKESQSALWAAAAAIAAAKSGRPVKLRADRDDDMMVTGKRHCFHYEYEVGYDDSGKIVAAKVDMTRAPATRPTCRARSPRARLPLRQYLLSVRRRYPRRLRQDQYPVEYGLPRLRRPAGRDRNRICDRRDRAQSGPRCAGYPPPEFLWQGRA
jgi:CO/xanthine dehydrogenase Mo-binding subunit